MPDPHPRYVVLEQKREHESAFSAGQAPLDFFILDRWYCSEEVCYVSTGGPDWVGHAQRLRRTVAALCTQWNAEHDAWLVEAL